MMTGLADGKAGYRVDEDEDGLSGADDRLGHVAGLPEAAG
jgi:hypothetical protein